MWSQAWALPPCTSTTCGIPGTRSADTAVSLRNLMARIGHDNDRRADPPSTSPAPTGGSPTTSTHCCGPPRPGDDDQDDDGAADALAPAGNGPLMAGSSARARETIKAQVGTHPLT